MTLLKTKEKNMIFLRFSLLGSMFLAMVACNTGPKIIPVEESASSHEQSTGVFTDEHAGHDHASQTPIATKEVHTVKVKEVLPTDKYVYLFVEEEDEEFWIATSKVEVNVGETYFYRDGLLKTNFHSKEHDRTFDQMYLVSQIVPISHGNNSAPNSSSSAVSVDNTPKDVVVDGSVRIADLVADPKKFEGQAIQLSGVVDKVNPNIMNRNWLHLKDGSQDDYDLVVTSEHAVPEGHTVTMTGTVTLNKDFGAGYQYEIIVEDGHLVQ